MTQPTKQEKKSPLRKMLEADGWEFLLNESLTCNEDERSERNFPLTPENVERKYRARIIFDDVKVTDLAYDSYGSRLPNMVGVYVKRRQ